MSERQPALHKVDRLSQVSQGHLQELLSNHLATFESSRSRPSRFLLPLVQSKMNPLWVKGFDLSLLAFHLQPIHLSS